MGNEKLSNRTGIPRQEFPIGASSRAVVGGLDDLFGRQFLLPRGGLPTHLDQSGDLRDLQPCIAIQQEVAEHPQRVVILPASPEKPKGGLQHRKLMRTQRLPGDFRVLEPLIKRLTFRGHGIPSMKVPNHGRIDLSAG
jgi:hypothetical protein